jgi:Protein of unknown function (DUF2842)
VVPHPSWKKPTGTIVILVLILVWAGLVASLSAIVGTWPNLLQLLFYGVSGIIWILPLKPLLRWMQHQPSGPPEN